MQPLVRNWPVALLVFVLIVTALALPSAQRLGEDFSPNRLMLRDDRNYLFKLELQQQFGSDDSIFLVLRAPETILTPEMLRAFRRFGTAVESLDHVERVIHPANIETAIGFDGGIEIREVFHREPEGHDLAERREYALNHPLLRRRILSSDGRVGAVVIELADLAGNPTHLVREIRRLANQSFPPEVEVYLGGITVVAADHADLVERSMRILVPAAIGAVSLTLLWAFRSEIAVAAPLLAMLVAGIWWSAILERIGMVNTALISTLPILALVIGVANCVYLMASFGYARSEGLGRRSAVTAMLRRSGMACLFCCLTTAVGYLSLGTSQTTLIAEYGIAAGIAVACTFAASLLILTPTLALYPRGPRPPRDSGLLERTLARGAAGLHRRRREIIAVSLLLGLAAAAGATRIVNDRHWLGELEPTHPLEVAGRILDADLGGMGTFVVSIRAEPGALYEPSMMAAVQDLQDHLESRPEVRATVSYIDYLKDINRAINADRAEYERLPDSRELAAQYLLLLESGDDNRELSKLISIDHSWAVIRVGTKDIGDQGHKALHADVRNHLASHRFPMRAEIRLGGSDVVYSATALRVVDDFVTSFSLSALSVFAFTCLILRSVRLGIVAMIPNLLPILLTLGFMGIACIPLQMSTAACFAVVIGIVIDDTIHFTTICKRELVTARTVEDAVRRTFTKVGRAIVLTSLILFVGFALLGIGSPFRALRHLGTLVCFSLASALLCDLLLLPALLMTFPRACGALVPGAVAGPSREVAPIRLAE